MREPAELLGVPPPNPAREDTRDNDYVFERRVVFRHGDGHSSERRIDCYRRGHFVLEAKKLKQGAQTRGFDDALLRARSQAENYARALPADEGRPPFLPVVDVGNVIELYAQFSRSGATCTPFPDPRSHRIRLADLADERMRARLRAIWTDPLSLDPARTSAKATRDIADRLAGVAKSLEAAGHGAERVAGFQMRCLFGMFAEELAARRRFGARGAEKWASGKDSGVSGRCPGLPASDPTPLASGRLPTTRGDVRPGARDTDDRAEKKNPAIRRRRGSYGGLGPQGAESFATGEPNRLRRGDASHPCRPARGRAGRAKRAREPCRRRRPRSTRSKWRPGPARIPQGRCSTRRPSR